MSNLDKVRLRAEKDAERNGYFLNPDQDFLQDLLEGLEHNEKRYGYPSCPCRLASGKIEFDRDIICPCDYRDQDVEEFGTCYCALYVNQNIYEGNTSIKPVPERRPLEKQEKFFRESKASKEPSTTSKKTSTGLRFWYCRQCGYLCYREEPPYICPICKAKKEMFTEIPLSF